MTGTATALAHPNIAFIKYWGNRDDALRLPANGSVSMNLAALHTQTSVSFRDDLREDVLTITHHGHTVFNNTFVALGLECTVMRSV